MFSVSRERIRMILRLVVSVLLVQESRALLSPTTRQVGRLWIQHRSASSFRSSVRSTTITPWFPYCSYPDLPRSPFILSSSSDSDDEESSHGDNPTTDSKEASPPVSWSGQQFQLSIPAMLTLLADPLLSVVDTAFVGRLGTTALASLGACTSIFHLAFDTFRATTLATTSLVGPYYAGKEDGKKDNDSNATTSETQSTRAIENTTETSATPIPDLQTVTRLSLQFGTLLGLGVGAILLLATTPILRTMGIDAASALYPPAATYLQTRAWAAPCVGFTAVATGLFRGAGTTVIPLRASLVASGLNLVLDPLLMFGSIFGWGVRGAAAATALSQWAMAVVLARALTQQGMWKRSKVDKVAPAQRRMVYTTIAKANLSMMAKQGSLLGAWAYCTAQATRLGPAHVAAHQVALSVWLVVAFMLDSNAVAAQILASRYFQPHQPPSRMLKSLLRYQAKLALGQGLVATAFVLVVLAPFVPAVMATDAAVRFHLQQLFPTLAWQQVLVSCTLVTEALAAATQQFTFLAVGTVGATILSVWQLQGPTTVTGLWNKGIVTLFVGRWLTASLALWRALRATHRNKTSSMES